MVYHIIRLPMKASAILHFFASAGLDIIKINAAYAGSNFDLQTCCDTYILINMLV